MKYLKKFNESMNSELEFAIVKIKSEYDDQAIKELLDNEIEEWVEDDQLGDNYETKLEWYWDNNNGEAQEIIVTYIIDKFKSDYKKSLSESEEKELGTLIKKNFEYLEY